MHPAYSIIFFTVASGLGYGLIAVSLAAMILGIVPHSPGFAWSSLVIGSLVVAAGLVSSTFHLGRPERAWRALSQWRTSWLSREGVMATATFLPIALTALGWLTGGGWWVLSALLAILGSLITVYCTAMIYASLKPIPAWNHNSVPVIYIVLSLAGGGTVAVLLAQVNANASAGLAVIAALAIVAGALVKLHYWQKVVDRKLPASTASALGLPQHGKATLLELPHTSENYLQREMGFRIARKHAGKLKLIATLLTALALLLVLASTALPAIGASALLVVATASLIAALLIERWLFFAEARHTVMLYYGQDQ